MPSRTGTSRRLRQHQVPSQRTQQQATATNSKNTAFQDQAIPTEAVIAVSQQQSQELAKSLLLGSLSAILYSRDLIRETSFVEACFDVHADEPWSYEAWKTGSIKARSDDGAENGAFDAMQQGYLSAFQLRIFEDIDNPDNLLETYTLSFSYHNSIRSYGRAVSGVEMTGPEGKRASLNNLKAGFANFMGLLTEFLGTLPDLPERRYFKPKLFYNGNCPVDYQAPGFKKGSTSLANFTQADGLIKRIYQPSNYQGGFHSVNMSVAYLQWPNQCGNPSPTGLRYTDPLAQHSADASNTRNFNERADARKSTRDPSGNGSLQHPFGADQHLGTSLEETDGNNSSEIADFTIVGRSNMRANAAFGSDHAGMRHGGCAPPKPTIRLKRKSSGETSASAVKAKTHRTNRNKIHDSTSRPDDKRGSGEMPTEEPGRSSRTLVSSQDTVRLDADIQDLRERAILRSMRKESTPAQEDTQTMNEAPPDDGITERGKPVKIQLIPYKLGDLNERLRLAQAHGLDDKQQNSRSTPGTEDEDAITCQCGWLEDEDDNMIFCDWCKTWQHCFCYGFRGVSDPRIPKQHACYKCLFKGEDSYKARQTLRDLQNFTLLRRGIHIIEDSGYHDNATFATALGVRDRQTASFTFKRLESEGVVVAATGRKKKGFKSGKPRYEIVSQEPERSAMMRKFFDPLYKITQYYISDSHENGEHPSENSRTTEPKNSKGATWARVSSDLPDPSENGRQHTSHGQSLQASPQRHFRRKRQPAAISQTLKSTNHSSLTETPVPADRTYDASPLGVFSRGMSAE
ncbi:DNA-binding HORMA [Macrophomina phaseolina MS6]|uniref:DNA-binding HORMA n=1 Tax=Macrophomina phaseolina (strain MS6) TaxID=1126212 RepID=K2QTQ4_MACPH|nr:DNA-binding HORMA [Macrophomina phaseolina MS6]